MSNVGASGKASGGELEEKVDLTPETDAKLAQSLDLAKAGQVKEALNLLSALEKRCRVGNDNPNLVRVCEASLKYCKEYATGEDAVDNELLITTLNTLATRRSQKTQAIRTLVQTCIPWCIDGQYTPLDVLPEQRKGRDKLVEALREISDGKIFLEAERARLTRCMAMIMVRGRRCLCVRDQSLNRCDSMISEYCPWGGIISARFVCCFWSRPSREDIYT